MSMPAPVQPPSRAEIRRQRANARNRRKHPTKHVVLRAREFRSGRPKLVALPIWRPQVRADCEHVQRPCPFVACKWNLYLDVTRKGSIVLNFPDLEPSEMPESCALDVADRGEQTLEQTAARMNVTRERVRQIISGALRKIRRYLPLLGE
jgi:hypothetical protein